MKLKTLFLSGFLLMGVHTLYAQQDPKFTQFYFNKVMINPAAAGVHNNFCATVFQRVQWTGFKGAPLTTQVTIDGNLKQFLGGKHDVGVGITVFNDMIGFFRNTGLRVSGAYRFKVGPGRFGVGAEFGMLNQGLNNAQWISNNPNDPNIPQGGPSTIFDAGLGVYYSTDKWYAGISSLHLPSMRLRELNVRQTRHYYIMGGYTFKAIGGNPNWDLSPNALIKTDFAAVQFDVNCNVIFKQRYWGGLAYSFQDNVALNLGATVIQKPKWNLSAGYSYDLTTSRILKFSSGSHEVMLRYCFIINQNPPSGGGVRVRDLDSKRDLD
jgi:type IX secretion system PorP/SprF family membrane protein